MANKPVRRNITYAAPVGSIDLAAFNDDGDSHELRPCPECLPWYAEVINDPESGKVMVREWHAIDCPLFQYLLSDEDDDEQPSSSREGQ